MICNIVGVMPHRLVYQRNKGEGISPNIAYKARPNIDAANVGHRTGFLSEPTLMRLATAYDDHSTCRMTLELV